MTGIPPPPDEGDPELPPLESEPQTAYEAVEPAPDPAPEFNSEVEPEPEPEVPPERETAYQPDPTPDPTPEPEPEPETAYEAVEPAPEPDSDIDGEPEGEVDAAEEPDAAPVGPSRTLVRSLAALAVLFFLGTLALAVLASRLSSELSDERDDRRGVERTASRFAERLLTYDYRSLDQSKKAVLDLSTGNFKKQYEQAFDGGLERLLTETQAQSSGTVKDVYISSVEDDAASAITVVNAVASGTAGRRRSLDSYIQLDLLKVQGQWRVETVTNLNFGQSPDSAAPGPGTDRPVAPGPTATSAPPATAPPAPAG